MRYSPETPLPAELAESAGGIARPETEHGPQCECGVFGIYAPDADVARETYFGLYALQHRGQESAGISVFERGSLKSHADMGLVSQVFTESTIQGLSGEYAIGHNRYSTTGGSKVENVQPINLTSELGPFAFAHNGNLTNSEQLREYLVDAGVDLDPERTSDSYLAACFLANAAGRTWEEKIEQFMEFATGGYSAVLMTPDGIRAIRDPRGLRPLSLATVDGTGWAVASETAAFRWLGMTPAVEIQPGEVVKIDRHGYRRVLDKSDGIPTPCVFEQIYLSKKSSKLEGESVNTVRKRLGRELAREAPADVDVVIGVPKSAIPHAMGYAHELGLRYDEGIDRNDYVGRTFIDPDERLRGQKVEMKMNPLTDIVGGKRIAVVDDSIVRGNTSRQIVKLLRDAGATEVHMRVASPPIAHPCYMGVDMSTYGEFIAQGRSVEDIAREIGADSLAYLSLDGKDRALRKPGSAMCDACMTGEYPVDVPDHDITASK